MGRSASAESQVLWSKVQERISQLRLKAHKCEEATKFHVLAVLSTAEDLLAAFTDFGHYHAKEIEESQCRQKSLERKIASLSEHLRVRDSEKRKIVVLLPRIQEDVGNCSYGGTVNDTASKNVKSVLKFQGCERVLKPGGCRERGQRRGIGVSPAFCEAGSKLDVLKGNAVVISASERGGSQIEPVLGTAERMIDLEAVRDACGARLTRAGAKRKLGLLQQHGKWYENPVITKKLESLPRKRTFLANLSRAEGITKQQPGEH